MIYFDNAATTKVSKSAAAKLTEVSLRDFGNPSSNHAMGQAAKREMEEARTKVASAIGAAPEELTFTSGGTEANNLAIIGACEAALAGSVFAERKIAISAAEHPSVYKVGRYLRKAQGFKVGIIPVANESGIGIDIENLDKFLDEQTALLSIMLVNNEVGTIFNIAEVAKRARELSPNILVHCDAIQALGKIPFTVEELGIDLLSISAHKIHGPKGIGALYVRSGAHILPRVFGGGQECNLRPGTEGTPQIAAFGVAAENAMLGMEEYRAHVSALRDYLLGRLAEVDVAVINSNSRGAPHIVNFSLPAFNSDSVVEEFSNRGICISRGAACKSNHAHGPSMLMSFGLPAEIADHALRVSFCEENTLEEVDEFVSTLKVIAAS